MTNELDKRNFKKVSSKQPQDIDITPEEHKAYCEQFEQENTPEEKNVIVDGKVVGIDATEELWKFQQERRARREREQQIRTATAKSILRYVKKNIELGYGKENRIEWHKRDFDRFEKWLKKRFNV